MSPATATPPVNRRTLTKREFAEEHGVSERGVDDWIRRGKIRAVKYGRLVRIPVEESERIAAEGIR